MSLASFVWSFNLGLFFGWLLFRDANCCLNGGNDEMD